MEYSALPSWLNNHYSIPEDKRVDRSLQDGYLARVPICVGLGFFAGKGKPSPFEAVCGGLESS